MGRIEPELDRRNRRLRVHAVHPEPGQPFDDDGLLDAILRLAAWLGAESIESPLGPSG